MDIGIEIVVAMGHHAGGDLAGLGIKEGKS
jgi:hypothetical protein